MFWDSSAIVAALVSEARSSEVRALMRRDSEPAIWWATPVECASALQRRAREKVLPRQVVSVARQRLQWVLRDADVVEPVRRVRDEALRLLDAHPIRAADALQLAAARVWAGGDPPGLEFVCLDERLSEAAAAEGFEVFPSPSE